jgi:hypothetical protein
MKKLATSALLLFAFLPLVIAPHIYDTPFTSGKIVFARGLAFLVIGLVTLYLFFTKEKEQRSALLHRISVICKDRLFQTMALGIIFLVFSTIFAFDISYAFFGESFRGEGFLTLFAFFCIFFSMLLLFEKKHWRLFFIFSFVSSLIVLAIEYRQKILGMYRPDSLTGNPIFLGGYLFFAILIALWIVHLGIKEKNKLFITVGSISAITSIVGIFLTVSRGSVIALAFAILLTATTAFVRGKKITVGQRTLRFFSGIILTVLLFFGGIFLATRHNSLWQKIPGIDRIATTSIGKGSAVTRIVYTKLSFSKFFPDEKIQTVLFGWGWDNFVFFFQKNYYPAMYSIEAAVIDRPHNKLSDMLVMTGVVGLVTYLIIWVLLFRYCLRLIKKDTFFGFSLFFF